MFKSKAVITSTNLKFSTVEEFKNELKKYYDSYKYSLTIEKYEIDGKIISKTETLENSETLKIEIVWDYETSYIEFYSNSYDGINILEADGYIRTVTTANI